MAETPPLWMDRHDFDRLRNRTNERAREQGRRLLERDSDRDRCPLVRLVDRPAFPTATSAGGRWQKPRAGMWTEKTVSVSLIGQ